MTTVGDACGGDDGEIASTNWLGALARRAADSTPAADLTLSIEYRITVDPDDPNTEHRGVGDSGCGQRRTDDRSDCRGSTSGHGVHATVHEKVWHARIEAGRITFGAGPHPNPTLTLAASRTVTEAIANNGLSAQRAFLNGDLRVGGDIAKLLEHQSTLEQVAAMIAKVPA